MTDSDFKLKPKLLHKHYELHSEMHFIRYSQGSLPYFIQADAHTTALLRAPLYDYKIRTS